MSHFLQFVLGVVAGGCWALIFAMNFNSSFDSLDNHHRKLVEICLISDSVPKEYDFDGELICENGAKFNYNGNIIKSGRSDGHLDRGLWSLSDLI